MRCDAASKRRFENKPLFNERAESSHSRFVSFRFPQFYNFYWIELRVNSVLVGVLGVGVRDIGQFWGVMGFGDDNAESEVALEIVYALAIYS